MNRAPLIVALGLGMLVSACAQAPLTEVNPELEPRAVQTASADIRFAEQGAVATQPASQEQPKPAAILSQVRVEEISVSVPRSLRVSEANRYYPSGDIVWREDPIGDRHAQVQKIVADALGKGTEALDGPVPVKLNIVVVRFHALTEKARYTVGGVHAIRFRMQVIDAETGDALSEPRVVEADLDAFGGQQAIAAEARGITQKVRISNHLAEVIRQEMSRPEGYVNARLGFFQLVNKL